jgi:AmmeMemoRadiSam system protein B
MPSPVEDRPGLLIRDPYHYSDVTLIVPPQLVPALACFDGERTDLDLRQSLVAATGDFDVSDLQRHLIDTLSQSGFFQDEQFARMQEERRRSFAQAAQRDPAHAGSAYPSALEPLRETMGRYMNGGCAPIDGLIGIAAPHVSPEGGWESYQAAYGALGPAFRDRTFVILGTSHYGEPERFGLTRKPFVTPFGVTQIDTAAVDWLSSRAPAAVHMEDYCHAVEHSIEFQVVFLQHLFGPDIRILPILCGPYARSLYLGERPEDDEGVQAFLDALGEFANREAQSVFWVLGIDMTHIGRRYGDSFAARAEEAQLLDVRARDRARIERLAAGDCDGFWDLVQPGHDDLKWCGSSPLYTFLRAEPRARGELLRYQQWNIDPQSVVSFAGIAFRRQD